MKLINAHSSWQRAARGSAVLVVLVLLGIMAIYLGANSVTLHNLRVDLRVVEAKQLRRYHQPVVVAKVDQTLVKTNIVALSGTHEIKVSGH